MSVRVTEGMHQGCDVLIGMDIISPGDFSVTNQGDKTAFLFRLPSMEGGASGRLVPGANGIKQNIAAYIQPVPM